MKQLYLDYHATTPVDPRVYKEMEPFFAQEFGNPSSKKHNYGLDADKAVELARTRIAKFLNADSKEIIFTSGASESNNLAIKGLAFNWPKGSHIITTSVEHASVIETCKFLETQGYKVTYLPVDENGLVNKKDLEKAITPETKLISIIFANNEIGTINDIEVLSKLAQEKNILFHTDAVQAIGRVAIDLSKMPVDLLSFSSHKIYGPKGTGVLFVRQKSPRLKINPLIHGGGHEKGLRAGTLHVTGIVGVGKACEILIDELTIEAERTKNMSQILLEKIKKSGFPIKLNGHAEKRLPNNLNITFKGADPDSLHKELREIAYSTGSACSTAKINPSHVLKAIGLTDEEAYQTLRFSVGRFTTADEVERAVKIILSGLKHLRPDLVKTG